MKKIKKIGVSAFVCSSIFISCNRKMLTRNIKDEVGKYKFRQARSFSTSYLPQGGSSTTTESNNEIVYKRIVEYLMEDSRGIKLKRNLEYQNISNIVDLYRQKNMNISFFNFLIEKVSNKIENKDDIIEGFTGLVDVVGDLLWNNNDVRNKWFNRDDLPIILNKFINWVNSGDVSRDKVVKIFENYVSLGRYQNYVVDNEESFLRWCIKDSSIHARFVELLAESHKITLRWTIKDSEEFESIFTDLMKMEKANFDSFKKSLPMLFRKNYIAGDIFFYYDGKYYLKDQGDQFIIFLKNLLCSENKQLSCKLHLSRLRDVLDIIKVGNNNNQKVLDYLIGWIEVSTKNNIMHLIESHPCSKDIKNLLIESNFDFIKLLHKKNNEGNFPSLDLSDLDSYVENNFKQYFELIKNSNGLSTDATNATNATDVTNTTTTDVTNTTTTDVTNTTTMVPSPLHYFIAHLQSFGTGAVMSAGVLIVDNIFTALARR